MLFCNGGFSQRGSKGLKESFFLCWIIYLILTSLIGSVLVLFSLCYLLCYFDLFVPTKQLKKLIIFFRYLLYFPFLVVDCLVVTFCRNWEVWHTIYCISDCLCCVLLTRVLNPIVSLTSVLLIIASKQLKTCFLLEMFLNFLFLVVYCLLVTFCQNWEV